MLFRKSSVTFVLKFSRGTTIEDVFDAVAHVKKKHPNAKIYVEVVM